MLQIKTGFTGVGLLDQLVHVDQSGHLLWEVVGGASFEHIQRWHHTHAVNRFGIRTLNGFKDQ